MQTPVHRDDDSFESSVTQIGLSDQASGSAIEDTTPGVLPPARRIAIPTTDVVSYAFARYGTYELEKPVGLPLRHRMGTFVLFGSDCADHLDPARSTSMPKTLRISSQLAWLEERCDSSSVDSRHMDSRQGTAFVCTRTTM